MKALIQFRNDSHGEHIDVLGMGHDESAARAAAYAYLHSGHNPYYEEQHGFTLVDMTPELEDLMSLSCWDDVGEAAVSKRAMQLNAFGCMKLNAAGKLTSGVIA